MSVPAPKSTTARVPASPHTPAPSLVVVPAPDPRGILADFVDQAVKQCGNPMCLECLNEVRGAARELMELLDEIEQSWTVKPAEIEAERVRRS